MANIQSISHKKSAVVENGAPKLPTISQLELGELAINFADGYETLSIKNNNDEIVTFTNDLYWKDKELVIAAALNDLEQNKQDVLVYDEVPTENSENPVTSGGIYNYITEIEQGTAAALNDLNGRTLTEDTPTQGSTKLVTSGGLYTYITDIEEVVSEALNDLNDRKQDILDIDNAPTQYSNNPISSNAAFEMSKVTAAALNDLNLRKANTSDVQQMIEDYGLNSLAPVATSGSYNDLTDTPNTTVTLITTTGTQIATVGGVTLYAPDATVTLVLNTGTEIAQVGSTSIYAPDNTIYEVNHGTSDTTFTLTPNTMHIWGEVASLNLSLPQDTNTALDEYLFTFTCPAAAPTTLTLPADVKWVQQPNLQEGKTYQVSIMNGLAGYLTDDMETSGDENIIEEIKLNGTALPITDKSVNIVLPSETDPIFSASPAAGITAANITTWNNKVSNVQADWNQTTTTAADYIKNKPTIPAAVTESTVAGWGFTKNTGTITGITMNGASKGTSGVIDLGTVLTSHQDISGKADKSAAIGSLSLSLDSTNYKITLSGTKVDGTTFTVADVIDLPLESVVVSGAYDNTTKKVVLTLKDGSTVDFSVADLVSGLQTEITSTNKLSADLIADGTTNKVVTAAEKTAWNNKSNFSGNYNDLSNKPTIPAAPGTLNTNNTTAQTVSASEALSGIINLHKVAKTGSYNDLLNKPTIPTALADLTADATHRLVTDTEKSNWNNKASSDTKNTAGATQATLGSNEKLYLVGAKTQGNNPLTYTDSNVYLTIPNGALHTGGLSANTVSITTGNFIDINTDNIKLTGSDFSGITYGTPSITLLSVLDSKLTSSDIPTLSKGTTTGSGNAVTDISVNGHKITLTKGSTFLTSYTETDPTVPAAVKAITATDISNWNNKLAALVSGTNIKTINGNSILGEGNISISGASGGEANVIESVKVNGTALTVTNKAVDITAVPASIVTQDATHRFVSDTEKSTWNNKANDTDVLHKTGYEIITGSKTITNQLNFNPEGTEYDNYITSASGTLILKGEDGININGDLNLINGSSISVDNIYAKTTANRSNAKIFTTNGNIIDLPALSKGTTTGSGNAVTDISVSGHLITLTKGSTFLQSGASSDDIEYSEGQGQTMYFLDGVTLTGALQSLDAAVSTKATDNLVVHKGGSETITGSKKFQGVYDSININLSNSNNSDITWIDEHNGEAYDREPFAWIKANDGVNTTTLQQALDAKEVTSHKVTSISSSSTNTQYPSALAVYNFGTNLVSQLTTIYSGSGAPSSSLGNNGDIYIKVT